MSGWLTSLETAGHRRSADAARRERTRCASSTRPRAIAAVPRTSTARRQDIDQAFDHILVLAEDPVAILAHDGQPVESATARPELTSARAGRD